MPEQQQGGEKIITTNRRARHEFFVVETYEAGIVLTGTEVKSLRLGNASLQDGFAEVRSGEVWMLGVHISPYEQGSYANADPVRRRKLLLNRKEIRKIATSASTKGMTLIPLKLYFRNNRAKVELGVCRGKKAHDKRASIKERDAEREMRREHSR